MRKWASKFYNQTFQPYEKEIIARLKEYESGKDLDCFYAEVERIDDTIYPDGRHLVLECVLAAALISKNKKDVRDGKNGLKDLNDIQEKIAKVAEKLACLLGERERVINPRYKTSKAITTPMKLYVETGMNMRSTSKRIDFKRKTLPLLEKYLMHSSADTIAEPSLEEMLAELGRQMKKNAVEPAHPLVKRLHRYRKATPSADFVRCFTDAINQYRTFGDDLPQNFYLSLQAITEITSAAIDSDGDGGTTAGAVRKALNPSRTIRP